MHLSRVHYLAPAVAELSATAEVNHLHCDCIAAADTLRVSSPMATGTEDHSQSEQFQQLMSVINASQARMDSKLDQFKAKVRMGQEEAAAKALKRARLEKPYTYHRIGNKEQASFNIKVEESLLEAQADVTGNTHTSSSINKAREALEKGLGLLAD